MEAERKAPKGGEKCHRLQKFNEKWHERDRAYENREKELVEDLYPLISSPVRVCCPNENGRRRPSKVTPAKAAFLTVVKEDGKETPYRKLASSDWVEVLEIEKVHYTTIHKAIKRLPSGLLESALRILGERVTNGKMDAVIDATGVKIRKYEIEEYRGEERRKRQDVKLNGIWDAMKRSFTLRMSKAAMLTSIRDQKKCTIESEREWRTFSGTPRLCGEGFCSNGSGFGGDAGDQATVERHAEN